MTVLTIDNTMLYCPKCQKIYDQGSQRFCSNEGERLISALSSDEFTNHDVLTNTLSRKSRDEGDEFSSISKSSQIESENFTRPNFRPPPRNIYRNDSEFELELELEPLPKVECNRTFTKQREQLIELDDILISPEPAQSEKKGSTEAETFDFDNPQDLLGKTIANRYRILEQIGADESSIFYLAEDKINSGEKISLKILSGDDGDDIFTDKILTEERLSLTQINHPNIAKIYDCGELTDGKPYIITEHTEGATVKDYLDINEQFDALRVARIIRQASDAFGEAHQNNIPHRNLKPENIFLIVDANGVERVKLTNFGAAKEKLSEHNLLYKSPEQIAGKIPDFSGDIYSLAIIAYQMLTNRFPFDASSVGDLLKLQREGFQIRPSDVRSDLPPSVDDILRKALSFSSFDRYSKARDFGDDFFGEIIAAAPLELEDDVVIISNQLAEEKTISVSAPLLNIEKPAIEISFPIDDYIHPSGIQEKSESESVKPARDSAREKSLIERSNQPGASRSLSSVFGIAVLIAALLGAWYYFVNNRNQKFVRQSAETVSQNPKVIKNPPIADTNLTAALTPEEIEARPAPRSIQSPPDGVYFQNDKNSLSGNALENFLEFSIYYPKDWTQKAVKNNFLDVSKVTENNLPIEQILVSYYNSKGTYSDDLENFPALVKESNATLEKIVPNYQMISEEAKIVNNRWQAYEVKFQGTGKTAGGENITLWGKRLFIPTAIRGMKNGYVLTLLATSLSEDVKNVDDVGVKGELSTILETFEPRESF